MTAFSPAAASVTLAATAASADVALPATRSPVLLLQNAGPNTCFVQLGVGVQTALTTTGLPVLSGQVMAINPGGATHVAGICAAAGTATLFVTAGTGNVTGGD
jgi:hypothetical protein